MILKVFPKTLPPPLPVTHTPNWSPVKLMSSIKKNWKTRQEKRKIRGGEKVKGKNRDCCVTFRRSNYLKILLSAHARILKAFLSIRNRTLPSTWLIKSVTDSFVSFWAREWPGKGWTSFKSRFGENVPGANEFIFFEQPNRRPHLYGGLRL